MTVDILQRSTLVLKNGGQNTIQYNTIQYDTYETQQWLI